MPIASAPPGGALVINLATPVDNAVAMADAAVARIGPSLSPDVHRIEISILERSSPDSAMTRRVLVYDPVPGPAGTRLFNRTGA